jgi:hypothetical protein
LVYEATRFYQTQALRTRNKLMFLHVDAAEGKLDLAGILVDKRWQAATAKALDEQLKHRLPPAEGRWLTRSPVEPMFVFMSWNGKFHAKGEAFLASLFRREKEPVDVESVVLVTE